MALTAKERDEYDKSLAEDLNAIALKFVEKANSLKVTRGLTVRFRICNDQRRGHYLEVRRDLKNKSIPVFETHGKKKV